VSNFPFDDVSSFRDFIVFVQTYVPDRFRPREGAPPDQQWTLDLAFEGLRHGIESTVAGRSSKAVVDQATGLIDQSYDDYRNGREVEGFGKLEQLHKLLGRAVV
jgi:hypothetical protein